MSSDLTASSQAAKLRILETDMPTVIEELSGEVALDPVHVQERIEDWAARLSQLYGDVISWLPELASDRSDTVEMNEELMRSFGVAPVHLPILRLTDARGEVARLVPRGLWIIGANGRVDLFSHNGQHLIVDRSEYFSPPRWEVAPALERLDTAPLTRDVLRQAIL